MTASAAGGLTTNYITPYTLTMQATTQQMRYVARVKISGPVNEEFDIEMATGYFQRFANSPAWVIMVGQGTVLEEDTVHYAKVPRPGQSKLISGRHFYYVPHVDYCFKTPPPTLQVQENSGEVTKICLHNVAAPARNLIFDVAAEDPAAALSFGETRLIGDSDDAQLLEEYVQIAEAGNATQRARAYLKAGLDRRPICVAWHRAYQDSGKNWKQQAEMEKEYDAMLQKSPGDANLLYLAGRVAGDRKKSRELFHQATRSGPAISSGRASRWPTMRPVAAIGRPAVRWPRKRWRRRAIIPARNSTCAKRLALRELDKLEAEGRQGLAAPANSEDGSSPVIDLCEVLVMQNKPDEALRTLNDWQSRLPAEMQSPLANSLTRLLVQYMAGDFEEVQRGEGGELAELSSELRLHALLAGGRVKDAVDEEALKKLFVNPWNALAASIAWSIAGDSRQADAWREKAAAALEELNVELEARGRAAAGRQSARQGPIGRRCSGQAVQVSADRRLDRAVSRTQGRTGADGPELERRPSPALSPGPPGHRGNARESAGRTWFSARRKGPERPMTREQFDSLVERIEKRFGTRPLALRMRIALLLILGIAGFASWFLALLFVPGRVLVIAPQGGFRALGRRVMRVRGRWSFRNRPRRAPPMVQCNREHPPL